MKRSSWHRRRVAKILWPIYQGLNGTAVEKTPNCAKRDEVGGRAVDGLQDEAMGVNNRAVVILPCHLVK